MQTKLFNSAIVFILLLFVSTNLRATSYTWKGGTSSDWATASNWNPNTGSAPGPGDNVTIAPGTYTPNLDGDRTIANFTISGSTLDLQTYTLTVTGSATCSGGNVNNGTLSVSSSSTTTFSGTQFGATLSVRSSSILLNGGIFNSAVNLFKSSSTSSTGTGGCTFNAPVLITDSGTGALTLSNNSGSPDVFNSTLKVNLKIANASVYLAHRGIGNQFNGSVTFSSTAGGHIYSNYYGTATYNDSIILDGLTSNVNFGTSTGTCVQSSGHRLLIGSGGFSSGELHLRNFTQSGTTDTLNLLPGGSSTYLNFESGCVFNSPVNAFARRVFLNGGRFLATSYFSVTGSPTSTGGSYFGAPVTIINDGVSNPTFSADTFATDAIIHGKTGVLHIVNSVFLGNTTFKNGVFLYGCDLKGNVTLDTSGASMHLGDIDYNPTTLYSGVRMTITPAYTGGLNLENFTQLGPDTLYITTQGSSRLTVDTGSIFNGPFVYRGPAIYFDGGTFNNTVDAFVSGSTSSDGKGGCIFNSTVTIKDSCTSPAYFRMAVGSPDMFNGDAFFIRKSTGSLNPVYSANSVFKGNITLDGSAAIGFGTSGNKVIFAGGANQMLNKNGSAGHFFKKIEVNKSAGTLKLNFPLTLTTDSFFLTKGIVLTDATNLLSVPSGGIIFGGSDSAYIHGPLKKAGSTSFDFPLGDSSLHYSGSYHPITIGTSSSTTDSYTAQYFATGQTSGSSIDNTMEQLSDCEYWTLNRNTGTSNVSVTLGWNTNACNVYDPANMKVAGWNGSAWKDKGNSAYTGDISTGSVTSSSSVSTFGSFTLADNVCTTIGATASGTDVGCNGISSGSATVTPSLGTSDYAYLWSNGSTLPSITSLPAASYSVTVTDYNGCTATANTTITEPTALTALVAASTKTSYSGNNRSASVFPSGGTMPYTYSWSNGATTQAVSGLSNGTYSVTVTDAHGCTTPEVLSLTTLTACEDDSLTVLITISHSSSDTLKAYIKPTTGLALTKTITPLSSSGSASWSGDTIIVTAIGTDTISVTFHVKAGCALFDSPINFRDSSFIWLNNNKAATDTIVDIILVNSPVIVFVDSSNLNITNAGVFFDRTYVFKNSSSTPFTGYFFWADTLADSSRSALRIDKAVISSPIAYFDSSWAFDDTLAWIKARIVNLTSNDSIIITETIHVTGCPSPSNNKGRATLHYGCDSTNICAAATHPYIPTTARVQDKPVIQLWEMNEFYRHDTIRWTCPIDSQFRVYRIRNTDLTGNGVASGIHVQLWRHGGNNISFFDTSQVHVYKVVNGVRVEVPKITQGANGGVLYGSGQYFPPLSVGTYDFDIAGPVTSADTFFLTYIEKKHCLTDDSANFNHGVIMHQITTAVSLTHPCFAVSATDDNSGRAGRPIQEFSLLQNFENYHAMMDSGAVEWFDISNRTLLREGPSYNNANGTSTQMGLDPRKLQMQVQLELKPGLRLRDSIYFLSPLSGGLDTIFPVDTMHSTADTAQTDIVTVTFNMPVQFFEPLSSGGLYNWGFFWQRKDTAFQRFFNTFYVHFQVSAHCGFSADGFAGIEEKFYIIYDSTCSSPCRFPLATAGTDIQIHCPGCKLPAWNVNSMNLYRTNFGWVDMDNNNHPDSLTLAGDTWDIADPDSIAPKGVRINKRIMIGDDIQADITASATDGALVTFGNIGFPFEELWLELSGNLLSKMQFLGGSGSYNTSSFTIPSSALKDTLGLKVLDLSLDTLNLVYGATGLLPTAITGSDYLNLTLRFRVIENLNSGISYFTPEDVSGKIFISGVSRYHIDSIADPGEDIAVSLLDTLQRKKLAYWCTGWAGRVTGVGVDFHDKVIVSGKDLDNNPCYKRIDFYATTDVGQQNIFGADPLYILNAEPKTPGAWNTFPYEVRDFMHLDSISFTIPSGWHADRFALITYNLSRDTTFNKTDYIKCQWHYYPIATVGRVFGDQINISIDQYHRWLKSPTILNSCNQDSIDPGDETRRIAASLILRMDDTSLCMQRNITAADSFPVTAYFRNMPQYLNPGNYYDTTFNVRGDTIMNRPDPRLTAPALNPPLTTVNNSSFTTSLVVRDSMDHIRDYCEHPFIFPESQHIIVDSMIFGTHRVTADTNGFFQLPSPILAYGADTVLKADIIYMHYDCSYLPEASSTTCGAMPNPDSVMFYYGCSCYNAATSLASVCKLDSVTYYTYICPPGLQVTITAPDTVRACDTVEYKLHFDATGQGIIRQIHDTITLPGGLSYINGSSMAYFGSSSASLFTSVTGNTLAWNFNSIPLIDTLGAAIDTFSVVFKALSSCSAYADPIISKTHALSYCGKSISFTQNSASLNVLPPAWQTDAIVIDNVSCSPDSIRFKFDVTNASGVTDYNSKVRVLLPQYYGFVTATDSLIGFPAGSIDSIITIPINRTDSFCHPDDMMVRLQLYNTARSICRTDTCYTELLIDTTSCTIHFNGWVVAISHTTPTAFCLGDSVQLCANTGVSYSWNTNEVSQCIIAQTTGVYFVTVSDVHDCPNSDTVNITVDPTCCGNPLTEIDTVQAGTYTGYRNQNHNTRINASKVIYDHLDLAIAPTKKIVVPSGDTLVILNSHLYACGDKWQGIVVEAGGKLIIDSSLIEDAIIAVNDSANSFISVTTSTFDNNLTDIYLHDGSFSSAVIKGNYFLFSDAPGPFDETLPEHHIHLKNVANVTIGGGTTLAEQNAFKWKKFGIFAERAQSLKVYNSKFTQCGRNDNPPQVFINKGAGIASVGATTTACSLEVSNNNGSSLPNYLENCVYGVITYYLENISILNNRQSNNGGFNNCEYAAFLSGSRNATINVKANDFSEFKEGVFINSYNANSSLTISGNWFNCDASNAPLAYNSLKRFGTTAINVQTSLQNALSGTIDSNIVSNSEIGIHLRNVKGNNSNGVTVGNSSAAGNKVYYTGIPHPVNPLTIGYWLENCDRINVLNNSAISSTAASVADTFNFRGYAVDNTSQSLFCGNLADKMGSGMRVANQCQGTTFKTSTLDSCYNGFLLFNTTLPRQGTTMMGGKGWQNQWLRINTNDIIGTCLSFAWLYDQTTLNKFHPNAGGAIKVAVVAVNDNEGCLAGNSPDITTRNDWFYGIAQDTINYDAFSSENRFRDLEYFYSYAFENDDILSLGGNDSIYENLYDSLTSTNIGEFVIVDNYFIEESYNDAAEYNAGLTSTNDFEANKKTVNEILSDILSNDGQLTDEQIEDLEAIAYTNVIYGGKAVYTARALLRIDVDEQSDEVNLRKAKPQQIQTALKGQIVPNPAKESITYHYSLEANKDGVFEIRDISGRILLTSSLSGKTNSYSMSVSALPSGIYYYLTTVENMLVDQGKIVVIK